MKPLPTIPEITSRFTPWGDFNFWTVWRAGGQQPTVSHLSEETARTEAARLAARHPGAYFYVMIPQAVYYTDAPKVEFKNKPKGK